MTNTTNSLTCFASFTGLLCLATALNLASVPTASTAAAAQADPIDEILSVEIQKRHLPGISVAVVRDGQIIKTAARGLADLELGVPATPQTVFQIQSITKTFTSAAILLLVEEGRLSLDDPVSKHLEGTPDSWKSITIRHLLSHTSGIKDFINEPTASLRLDVTEEDVLKATAPRPLNFTPGERYAYSNSNYHLLAMIIRKLTGKWYGDFLCDRIFVPLGMSNTRPVSLSAIIPNRATGYSWTGQGFRKGEFVAESILSYGGGGILSTAPDLARWAQTLMSGRLLKPDSIAAAWTPAPLNNGGTAGYGLGWGIGRVAGHREINHSGGHITGFSTFLGLYPEDRLAVVVLLNRSGANPGRIARRIASIYVPELAPQPPKPIEDNEPETAALLRDCIVKAPAWEFDKTRFTPEMWKVLETQRNEIQAQAKGFGELKSLDLLSRSEADGLRTSRYRAVFANVTLYISVALDRDKKIAGLNSTDEE